LKNYIKAYSIGEAWILSLKTILVNGIEIPDDNGSIIEAVPFFIEMVDPPLTDNIIREYGDKKYLSFLNSNFNDMSGLEGWGYSYAQRLYSFNNVNQINGITEKLKKNPFSKSATISLLLNEQDTKHKPCLTTLDFKIRNSALIINAFFRSQDIGNKMYGDALELLKLGKKINYSLGLTKITLIHIIGSAHIYSIDCTRVRSLVIEVR
jgi:thymidylate synthase